MMPGKLLSLVAAGALAWAASGGANAQSYDSKATAEGWVWAQLKDGKKVDLNDRCSELGINAAAEATKDKPEWKHACRQLKPDFLSDVLTKLPWREQLRPTGIHITGAWIKGDIKLVNTRLYRPLELEESLVEGDILLTSARTDSNIAFTTSRIEGSFDAGKLRSEMSLDLTESNITQDLSLSGAKIDGFVTGDSAVLGGNLAATHSQIGINLQMARASLGGDVDLLGAKVQGLITLRGSTVVGHVDMSSVRAGNIYLGSLPDKKATYKTLAMISANVAGAIEAIGATIKGSANLNGVVAQDVFMSSSDRDKATFKDVDLGAAKISGTIDLEGATFGGRVSLNGAFAERVFMRSTKTQRATFKEVNLGGARISGPVEMDSAEFDGLVSLNGATARTLFMRSSNEGRATFKKVDLINARIADAVEMQGSLFDGDLIAVGLQVGATLAMGISEENKEKGRDDEIKPTSFKRITMRRAKIVGHLILEGSTVEEDVSATHLEIGGDFIMRNIESRQKMDLRYTRVAGNLDARGATFADLDLSGATVTTDLTLGPHTKGAMDWKKAPPGNLNLRNARAANLMDVADAWPGPGHLQIDGFAFSRLGPNRREPEWWDTHWIRLDQHYTPGPYDQIAAAYAAAGDRGASEDMRFLGRVRQREAEWHDKNYVSWASALFLEYVAGFGIGDYTFRVLFWVAAISVLGAIYLWYGVPQARLKGQAWCLGASLSRLLPVIEINKEFTEFFHDPDRSRLSGGQSAVFSIIGMVGWLLGAILVAAVAGLTQKP